MVQAQSLFIPHSPVTQVVQYVAPDGDDKASGDIDNPIQSQEEVDSRIGDTKARVEVNYTSGDYPYPNRGWWLSSHRRQAPVIFRADEAFAAGRGDAPVFVEVASGTIGAGSTTAVLDIPGLAVDLGQRRWIEIVDGPAAGDRRVIRNNTALDLTVARVLSAVPASGDAYRILESTGVNFVAPDLAGVLSTDYLMIADQLSYGASENLAFPFITGQDSGGGAFVFEGVQLSSSESFDHLLIGNCNVFAYGVNVSPFDKPGDDNKLPLHLRGTAMFCGRGLAQNTADGEGFPSFEAYEGWGLMSSDVTRHFFPNGDIKSSLDGYFSYPDDSEVLGSGEIRVRGGRIGRIFTGGKGLYNISGGSTTPVFMHTASAGNQAIRIGGDNLDRLVVELSNVDVLGATPVVDIFNAASLTTKAGVSILASVDGSVVIRVFPGGRMYTRDASGIGNGVALDWQALDNSAAVLDSWANTFFAAVGAAKGTFGTDDILIRRVS